MVRISTVTTIRASPLVEVDARCVGSGYLECPVTDPGDVNDVNRRGTVPVVANGVVAGPGLGGDEIHEDEPGLVAAVLALT